MFYKYSQEIDRLDSIYSPKAARGVDREQVVVASSGWRGTGCEGLSATMQEKFL